MEYELNLQDFCLYSSKSIFKKKYHKMVFICRKSVSLQRKVAKKSVIKRTKVVRKSVFKKCNTLCISEK